MEESETTPIVICDAVSQNDRRLKALQDDYARPDDRSLPELLQFGAACGSLINFYNLSDQVEGDWKDFFDSDPTITLASLAQLDLARIEAEFINLKALTRKTTPFDRKFQLLKKTFGVCYELALHTNSWLRWLQLTPENSSARLVAQTIVSVVEAELVGPLQKLKSYDDGAGLHTALEQRIGFDYGTFPDLWQLGNVHPDGSIYSGATPGRKIDHALPFLDDVLYPFIHGIEELQRAALANLAGSMDDSGDHRPNSALYIAFARLFQTAQDTINTFASRYSSFYYRDVLREKYLSALPDRLYLTFTLAASEEVRESTVAKGTLFSAGPDDDGMDILYAADRALLVTETAVARLLTLRVVQGPLCFGEAESPTAPSSLDVVQRVFSTTILLSENATTAADRSGPGMPESWATFGETQPGARRSEITEPASLGFALASSYLLLTGGIRKITLSVRYSAPRLPQLLAEIGRLTGLSDEEILRNVIHAAFTLYVSTAGGWFAVEKYAAMVLPEDTGFSLAFELPASAPALVAYDPGNTESAEEGEAAPASEDAAANPAPSLPTLKAYVKQEPVYLAGSSGSVYVYPLSLLATMDITGIEVQVNVKQLPGLQLENTDGPIDPSGPFYLFGGLPVVGSCFLVRHLELFVKQLDCFELAIEWFNLPQNDDGFKGYYRDYVLGLDGQKQLDLFDNQVFLGALSVLNPGSWFLHQPGAECPRVAPPEAVDVFLFRTTNDCSNPDPTKDGPLCTTSKFGNLTICPSPPPPYYDPSASAIKLVLAAPKYAFGNDLYAKNVLNAVIQDLPNAETCQERCDVQCKFLADAAQWIAECLARCRDVPDGQYKTCIQPRVTACIEQLLLSLLECLAECFIRTPRQAAGWSVADINATVDEYIKAEGSRPQLLRDLEKGLSGVLSSNDCVIRCLPLLQAAVCLGECEIQCGVEENYKQCMQKCLEGCHTSLQQAHERCLQACMDDCMKIKKELKYPNDPYVPQATGATADYSARCSFLPSQAGQACGIFFHLLPFGGYRQFVPLQQTAQQLACGPQSSMPAGLPSLLPQFAYAGALFLGFSGLAGQQRLDLLFQTAAGEAHEPPRPWPPVQWEALLATGWGPIQPAQRIADTTNGLQNTGIVTLDVPAMQPGNSTIFPGPYSWLRASVASAAAAFPPTIAIYPQALTATWQDNGGAYNHLKKPLLAHSVSSAVSDLPDIQTIDQPLESFGGRPPETAQTFYVRIGERLRHKDRAILSWDHERLVLERFPTIWKVQTLPARNPYRGNVPGEILVVVVAGPESDQIQDPAVPVACSALLAEIKSYLQQLTSPFVDIEVVNPVYVRIKVTATIKLQDQEDSGQCIARLNDELVEYLSPWFSDAQLNGLSSAAENGCGSEARVSEFIQTRPYVLALDSITFTYEPDRATLDWYLPTSAAHHEIRDADSVASPAPARNFY